MPFNIKATVPWDYSVDSINNGGNTLIALDKPEFRLQEKDIVVFVASVGDYFKLDYGSALTADNITIVNLAGGTGRWIRLNIENITWQLKTNWTLDSVSGNDENPGWGTDVATADATPPDVKIISCEAFCASFQPPAPIPRTRTLSPTAAVVGSVTTTCAALLVK